MPGPYRRLFQNASVLLSGNLVTAVSGFLALALTARSLSLDSFGLFVLVQSYVTVYALLVSLQSWQPVIKYGNNLLARGDEKGFIAMLSSTLIVDVSVALLATLVAAMLILMGDSLGWLPEEARLPLLLYLLFVVSNVSGGFNGVLRVRERFRSIAKIQLLASVARLLGVLVAVSLEANISGFVIAWVLPEVYIHIHTVIAALKEMKIITNERLRFKLLPFAERRAFVGFLFSNNVDVSVRAISRYLDVLLLGVLVGKESVAIYKIAAQICSIPLRFTDPLYQVLLPHFSRLTATDGQHRAGRMVLQLAGLGAAIFALVFLLLYGFGEWLIVLVFGAEFHGAYPLALVYFVSAVGALVGLPFVPYFQAIGKARLCMNIQLLATAVYLVTLYPLIDWLQATGAALAYVGYYFAWLALAMICFKKVQT